MTATGDRRRRWPWAVAVAVVLVLVAVAAVVAESDARAMARDAVRDRVVEALELDPGAEVEIGFGDGLLLPQLLAGRVAVLDLAVAEATFGELTGPLELHAEDVPLAAGEEVGSLEARFVLDDEDLDAVSDRLIGLGAEDVAFEDGEIAVSSTVDVFGAEIAIGLGLRPGVEAGAIVFTPTSLRLGDEVYRADELAGIPGFAQLTRLILQQQPVCVAEHLPASLDLESAEVAEGELIVTMRGEAVPLSLAERGSCG